jgi:chemotaxis signal transduction protein
MVVDSVSEVPGIHAAQRGPAPQCGTAVGNGLIAGIAPVAQGDTQRMLVLPDMQRLLVADRGLVVSTVTVARVFASPPKLHDGVRGQCPLSW